MTGGEDEMNIFNSHGLFDRERGEGRQQKKSRRGSKKHDKEDGLKKISTTHSTQTFYQAYYFPPLSLAGTSYELSLFPMLSSSIYPSRDKSAAAV